MTASLTSTSVRPQPGPPRDYRFPSFTRRRLANGIELVVAPVHKLPIVTITALVRAGAVCDPAGREGTAELTAKLLLQGTEAYEGAELTERFERLGASVDASADWDAAGVTLTAMSERIPDAFALMADVLRAPAFRQREVERLKSERLAQLLQLRAEPRGLADELFSRFVYRTDSRFAQSDGGEAESVAAITRDDVATFYAQRYVPAALTIIAVGDVGDDIADIITRGLGDWRGGAAAQVNADDRPTDRPRGVHIIEKTDAPQSELRIGHVGIPRNHPDFFPVNLMNAVLGGLFNSRINLNLREAHAYTYGAFSAFMWRRQAGPFVVSTAVRSDVTDAAAREILGEIDRMRAEPITHEELSLATSYLDGVFPIRFETTASIAAALAVLVVHGLPDDYYDRYRERVRATTAEQILEAAQRYLRPDQLQMLVVGDPAAVRAPLEALRFGPVAVYDALGRPIA